MSRDEPRFDPERDEEWRSRLTPLQYHVTREGGTERPGTGSLNMEDGTETTSASAVGTYFSPAR